MPCIVKIEFDLADYGTLTDLASICGNADYSFTAERLLNDIAEEGFGQAFGEYFHSKIHAGDPAALKLFDLKKATMNLWGFYSWLDNNARTIRKDIGLPNEE